LIIRRVACPKIFCVNSAGYAKSVYVYRVWIDENGYDDCGAYYSVGRPVFIAEPDFGLTQSFRSRNLDEAKRIARDAFPVARIAADLE
jgi:hypothetical protein